MNAGSTHISRTQGGELHNLTYETSLIQVSYKAHLLNRKENIASITFCLKSILLWKNSPWNKETTTP